MTAKCQRQCARCTSSSGGKPLHKQSLLQLYARAAGRQRSALVIHRPGLVGLPVGSPFLQLHNIEAVLHTGANTAGTCTGRERSTTMPWFGSRGSCSGLQCGDTAAGRFTLQPERFAEVCDGAEWVARSARVKSWLCCVWPDGTDVTSQMRCSTAHCHIDVRITSSTGKM